MKRQLRHALRAMAAFGLVGVVSALSPSVADAAVTCVTVSHTSTADILTTSNGEVVTGANPASNATATLAADGVTADLPDALSKVQWLVPAPAGTKLADLTDLSFRVRNDNVPASLYGGASYQLVIDPQPNATATTTSPSPTTTTIQVPVPGSTATPPATTGSPSPTTTAVQVPTIPTPVHFTTLVWQPYKNGYGASSAFRTFTLNPDGPEAWWSTKTLPAIPGAVAGAQAPFSLKTYLAAYPDAVVTAYGWNSGKGSAGLRDTVAALRFATMASCAIHTWATTPPPAYTGFAVRKPPLIEGRSFDHGNAGWIKPYHSTFEAELVADYDHVAPAGTAARTLQVAALAHRNASHTNGHGAPGQPLVFLPATLG